MLEYKREDVIAMWQRSPMDFGRNQLQNGRKILLDKGRARIMIHKHLSILQHSTISDDILS